MKLLVLLLDSSLWSWCELGGRSGDWPWPDEGKKVLEVMAGPLWKQRSASAKRLYSVVQEPYQL